MIRDITKNTLEFTISHKNADDGHLSSEHTEVLSVLFILILIKGFIVYYVK